MAKARHEVPAENRWNVEALYPNLDAWEKEFISLTPSEARPLWPGLEAFKGTLGQGSEKVKHALTLLFQIHRQLEKLYTYAHLKHDEDITDNTYKQAHNRITTRYHEFSEESSWFQPELLALPESTLNGYLSSPQPITVFTSKKLSE